MDTTLEIFDFDWTLFRSPDAPRGVPRKTFIHSAESLEPPHVPWRPGKEYWIEEVVRELKSAQRRRGTVTALITARRRKTEDRIRDLFAQRHLDPDYFFIREASFQKDKDRVHFKRKAVLSILKDLHLRPARIVVWEDDQANIDSIADLAKRRKIPFEGHLVHEPGAVLL